MSVVNRCPWFESDKLLIKYHDEEWGKPKYDDNEIFECFILEMFQAGLSWLTILKKREGFRKAFDNFDIVKVSKFDQSKIEQLLLNDEIIRHDQKIKSAVYNAKKFLEVKDKYGSFSKFIWSYVYDTPIINPWDKLEEVPSSNMLSEKICEDMKEIGFKFIGSTKIYSFLQAIGVVNDHLTSCDLKYED